MNAFVVLASILSVASAGVAPALPLGAVSIAPAGQGASTFVRAPAHDSASINYHRLGGNFAYSTAEAHAYARVTPQLSTITHPVAETTHVHEPAAIATVQPAAIVKTTHVARPVFGQEPILAEQPIIGPVRKHVEVTQPLFKTQTFVKSTPLVAVNQYVAQQHVGYVQGAPVAAGIATAAIPAGIATAAIPAGPVAAPVLAKALPAAEIAAPVLAKALPAALPAVPAEAAIVPEASIVY